MRIKPRTFSFPLPSPLRHRSAVILKDTLRGQLRVACGGTKPRVTKHLLNGYKVCACIEHVRRAGVAQQMRVHRRNAVRPADYFEYSATAASAQPPSLMRV